ncbi:MAG TPA: type II toxin-antitoxin system RelE/ParE family toxin [Thermoanaerobaculia bacterium]|nr:type II toxin-antitoxin system RelE/ParE family toxin [Thermoanaerobaculia bacterium]
MRVRLSTTAARDRIEAERNFELPDARERFRQRVRETIDRIVLLPLSGHPIDATVRKMRVADFPYDVIYEPDGDEIRILAVAHHRRQPGYWRR